MRESGLSAQLVSKLLNDDRAVLPQLPDRGTLKALARAFRLPETVVLLKAVEALGVDVPDVPLVYGLPHASNDELLAEIRRRLTEASDNQPAERLTPVDSDLDRQLWERISSLPYSDEEKAAIFRRARPAAAHSLDVSDATGS